MSDSLLTDLIKAIFVGRAGSGKTNAYHDICARTEKPALVIDTDTKIHTIRYLWKDEAPLRAIDSYRDFDKDNNTEIQYLPVSPGDFSTMYSTLNAATETDPLPDGSTIILDSLTSLADNVIAYGLSLRGSSGKSMGEIPIPDLPEWMGESMFLSSLFTTLKSCHFNVILTAHMTITSREVMGGKGQPSSTKETRQLITGGSKIAAKIPVYFDEVYAFSSIPPRIRDGRKPEYVVFSGCNDEVDIARTKLPLPYEMTITKGNKTLLEYIAEAQKEALA